MAKQNKSKKKQSTPLYSVYGARVSNSCKYINLSLVNGEDDDKQWATACIKRNGKYIKAKVTDDKIVLTIPRLDVEDDEDEDDEDEEDGKPLTDEGLIPIDDNDLPFDK